MPGTCFTEASQSRQRLVLMRSRTQDFGRSLAFRALGLGFRVQGLGFRALGLGFRVQGLGFRALGLGFRV